MTMNTLELDPYLQRQVEAGITGTDILHGHLKSLMYDAEQELEKAQAIEDKSGEAMDSMERRYWEGVLEAYGDIYSMTYALTFAINERIKARELH